MERSLAILMADLSGYTALTEVHGTATAMRTIQKYMELAGRSLHGESNILERVGDQLMIVSADPDDLAHTAISLLDHSKREPEFLHIHGGLHFGEVIEQNGHYFGSTVNLTARVVSHAKEGTILCTREFLDALQSPGNFQIAARGKVRFRNFREEKEIYELVSETRPAMIHVDPVCRMQVQKPEIRHNYQGVDYYFCSEECRNIFEKQPPDNF